MSDFSAMHLGRWGIRDKMFDRTVDQGPLTSISASPPNGSELSITAHRMTPSWTNKGRP